MKPLSLSERLQQFATDQDDLSRRGEKNLAAEAAQVIDSLTTERDQLASQVEMLKSFISQQAIPNLLVLSTDYPQCLGIDSAITDAEELVKMAPVKCLADIRAKAVRDFSKESADGCSMPFIKVLAEEWITRQAAKGGE
ncbi:hypothetical protein L5L78_15810 [Shewanella sp. SM34]|uniref:hypothetical protein n=1 Tax=Shewanella TaxID=22 RepID=UPI0021DAC879|nr:MULTISPECIES: hypothetical protein [unclassified Shewanella]MCU8057738.1 hypothetical protein [Shewanella sp. SM35]MCU8066568.1 hypothetical protein [Shewanella sp. SM34]